MKGDCGCAVCCTVDGALLVGSCQVQRVLASRLLHEQARRDAERDARSTSCRGF